MKLKYRKPEEDFSPEIEASGALIEFNNKILLVLRQKGKDESDKWALPTGKLEEGETSIQALKREMIEELDLHLEDNQIELLESEEIKYTKYDFIYYLFRVRCEREPELKLDLSENKKYIWIEPRKASEELDLIDTLDLLIEKYYNH